MVYCIRYYGITYDIPLKREGAASIRVTFKINNLLDAWYGEMTQAAWGGRDEFYTMPGRNYTLSVEYNF